MELNLTSFVGILLFSSGKSIKRIAVKYFTFQVNASVILFFIILVKPYSQINIEVAIGVILMAKLGIAPSHTWFIRILSVLEWGSFMWMSIPQKVIPLFIMSVVVEISWFVQIIFASVLISTTHSMSQLKIKKVLAASSVFSLN